MSNLDNFTSDPDWEEFAIKNEIPLPPKTPQPATASVNFDNLDFPAVRAYQALSENEWAESHPLKAVGYGAKSTTILARDGAGIDVKVSFPLPSRSRTGATGKIALPVFFVTHGGGWIQGRHTSEELWLLYPLYERFDFVVVSVEYRLAPENAFPIWIEDSEDVLNYLLDSPETLLDSDSNITLDLDRLILAGSSSGAGISSVLSQTCRDKGVSVHGVILNVPMVCDPRHFPVVDRILSEDYPPSYSQCMEIFMGSRGLLAVWNLIHPGPVSGLDPRASPLLGDLQSLPQHVIFVAGQDPLRDEGIAYARKLEKGNVPVSLYIYKGVPHNFGHYWELQATKKFWTDLRTTMEEWLLPS